MKILITGAGGFLGNRLYTELGKRHTVFGTTYADDFPGVEELDITKADDVNTMFLKHQPDVVIHAASMTNVDGCEERKELATRTNVDGTANIAEACKKNGAKLVYISTDFVFDGRRGMYKETDTPNPLNHYAWTKLEGEKKVQPTDIIARVCVLYGTNVARTERSFVAWALKQLQQGKEINVVTDHTATPTLINDIVRALERLIENDCQGIFHVCGSEKISRYDMALQLAEVFQLNKELIKPILAEKLQQKAKRPHDSSMDISKLRQEGIEMHNFREGAKIMKQEMEVRK